MSLRGRTTTSIWKLETDLQPMGMSLSNNWDSHKAEQAVGVGFTDVDDPS